MSINYNLHITINLLISYTNKLNYFFIKDNI